MEYKCNICDKKYKSYQSLWNHNHKFHSTNITIQSPNSHHLDTIKSPESHQYIVEKNCLKCTYCSKAFSFKQGKYRHEKNCKVKKQKELEDSIYKNELEKLKKDFELFKKQKSTKIINNYNAPVNNGSINSNNKNNNSNNKTLNLCEPGKENINLLTDTEKQFILSQGMNSIVSLVEQLNFNERIPQHHNFYTSAINDKHVNTIDLKTNNVIKKSKKDLFDEILCSHIQKLETIGQHSKKFSDVFNNIKAFIYLKKGKKEFMNQINMLSYNKRNMIINSWNNLIDDSTISPEDIPDRFENKVKQIVLMTEEECMLESNNIYNCSNINSDTDTDSDSDDHPQLVFSKKPKSFNL